MLDSRRHVRPPTNEFWNSSLAIAWEDGWPIYNQEGKQWAPFTEAEWEAMHEENDWGPPYWREFAIGARAELARRLAATAR